MEMSRASVSLRHYILLDACIACPPVPLESLHEYSSPQPILPASSLSSVIVIHIDREMQLFKYRDHPLLPADALPGRPHVLERISAGEPNKYDELANKTEHQLCDFIATTLYNLKEYPTAIQHFFAPGVKSFSFTRFDDTGMKGEMENLKISRKGNEITVSFKYLLWCRRSILMRNSVWIFFEKQEDRRNTVEWHFLSRSIMTRVASDGEWYTIWGAVSAMMDVPLENIQTSGLYKLNLCGSKAGSFKAKEASRVANIFGKRLCEKEVWKLCKDVTYAVELEKEESDQNHALAH